MSEIKVNSIKGVGASAAAITVNNTDGTCTANITNNLSNRNLIINGAMQVAQRGQSFSAMAHNSYGIDRFKFANNTDAVYKLSQSSNSPDGFANSLKLDCTTADTSISASDYNRLIYTFEGQDLQQFAKGTSSAKKGVLSFYVKTNKTGTYSIFIYDDDNSRQFNSTYTVSNTNWNRYTIEIPADTTGAIADDNGGSLYIEWHLIAGSSRTSGSLDTTWNSYTTNKEAAGHNVNLGDSTSNEWYLTGVQLEVDNTGSGVATDFEHRSFGQELQSCFRYCQVFDSVDGAYNRFAYANAPTSSSFRAIFPLMKEMRAKPSVAFSGNFQCFGVGSFDINNVSIESSTSSRKVACLFHGSVSVTAHSTYQFAANDDTSAKVTYSAEL